ncbi:BAG family molecular chaperone regulator 6-like [Trifolium medium]|uniref:BAG family molecular chaperone regulator 6-like n=1 Tax=Trifolium medium TaxID=97028 RepID=A0A392M424_9FABA|nr:BAG family molecular chaperone regulator 6-like [Trifolium medium]
MGSNLPSVCLRVDPLPRKKNGNGNSRSPSSPASKEHSKAIACETSKTSSCGIKHKAEPNSNIQNAPEADEKVKTKGGNCSGFASEFEGNQKVPGKRACEVVTLQEKLDSITAKYPQQQMHEIDANEPVEDVYIPIEVDKLDMNALKELPVGDIDEDIIDNSASEGLDSDMHAIKELPVAVLDENTATSEETNTSGSEVQVENKLSYEDLEMATLQSSILVHNVIQPIIKGTMIFLQLMKSGNNFQFSISSQ